MQNKLSYFLTRITDPYWIFRHTVVFGFITSLRLLLKASISYYKNNLQCKADLAKRYGYRSYALILGCSKNFGKDYAIDLASRGFQLILMGSQVNELQEIKEFVKEKLGSQHIVIKIIQTDFQTNQTSHYLMQLLDQLQNIDISIFVNGLQAQLEPIQINSNNYQLEFKYFNESIFPSIYLTKYLFKQMIERKQRSLILNITLQNEKNAIKKSVNKFMTSFTESKFLENRVCSQRVDFLSIVFYHSNENKFVQQSWRCVGKRFKNETKYVQCS